jgi:NADH-quinone oxidoreductase subunit C
MNTLDDITVERDNNTVRVDIANWQRAAEICKPTYEYFSYLSAIDWLPNPTLDGEKVFVPDATPPGPQEIIVDPVIRKGGGSSRFQLVAHVYNVEAHEGLTLVADVEENAPSWTSIYKGANWHEREAWEMFGIIFDGHPNLSHIYLPAEFDGHPMRKDFPLIAREVRPWPGLVDMEEMPPQDVIPADAGTQTPETQNGESS